MSTIELDVREDIATRNDPFQKIMGAVNTLNADGQLILHTPFIPKPLLKVMEGKGFTHSVEEISEVHYITTFSK